MADDTPRYRYTGGEPLPFVNDDGDVEIVHPGDIGLFEDEPQWGRWERIGGDTERASTDADDEPEKLEISSDTTVTNSDDKADGDAGPLAKGM